MDSLSLSAPLAFRTAFNRYGGYCIPIAAEHRFAAQTVIAGNVWEPQTVAFMTEVCRGGDIVHAGTFFGDFLPALAAAASKVWAFEPKRENWRCASLTVSLNGLTNVALYLGGLSDHAGEMALQTRGGDGVVLGGASHLKDDAPADPDAFEMTPVATLDSLLPPERPIAILQLDVEGHEQRALTGALETIRRWRPVLILETMPQPGWISQHLTPLGYAVARHVDENAVLTVGGQIPA
jgi:FkbM family methyltransferase